MRSFDPDETPAPHEDTELPARDVHDDLRDDAHEALLGALGIVTGSLPGAERREGQREMAVLVADAIESSRHLVVEAGTGIGKSLAYLVPVARSGRRTVVATATKALQDQLSGKEVPSLNAAGIGLHAAVLKGRQNYLCLQRLSDVAAPGTATLPSMGGDDDVPRTVATQLRRIATWAASTETGERDHLGFDADPRAWARVSMPAEECPGADRCPSGAACFAEAAKRRAELADVVIVNSALYGAHLSTGATLLPAHEVVVFDEAHELDAQLSRSLGVELSASRLRAVASMARTTGLADAPSIAEDLSRSADRLGAVLAERVVRGAQTGLDTATRTVLDDAARGVERLLASIDAAGLTPADLRRFSTRGAAVHLRGDLVKLRDPSERDLVFLEGTERSVTLVRAPVEVGPLLKGLWAEVTAVLCSATMPAGLEDRLGLDPAHRSRARFPSPFDYARHSLLYVPAHLPERRDPACETAHGRRARRAHRAPQAGARSRYSRRDARSRRWVARSASSSRPRCCSRASSHGPSCSTRSATTRRRASSPRWGSGRASTCPGRTLSLLCVDRLPFGRPDDPMLEARRERAGDAAFRTVDVPRASMLLAQGVGRLIRTAEDKGVVCVLDTRLATASYRGELLARLPPMRRTRERDEAVRFLREATAPS